MRFSTRLRHAWNAFRNKDPASNNLAGMASAIGPVSYIRPDRHRVRTGSDQTIINAILNRIAVDCTRARFEHVRVDDDRMYTATIDSSLNYIFRYEANTDQTWNAFLIDLVISMLDEGCVAIVPTDVDVNPLRTGSYNIQTMRVGKIENWAPDRVTVRLFNEAKNDFESVTVLKKITAIIQNPFYTVMNEPNSTMQRLAHKLSLLDITDDEQNSGKLNMIVQLPYVIKSENRRKQADARLQQLEAQLATSPHGIGYIDGTEKVIQLNRAIDSNLLEQIEYLTKELYSQIGITAEILNGTADESVMANYYDRTINVILDAVADEFERKFLTRTARSQGQAIMYFRNPFGLTPANAMADSADKYTRNQILTRNNIRSAIGFKPVDDPTANQLVNSNMPLTDQATADVGEGGDADAEYEDDPMSLPVSDLQ